MRYLLLLFALFCLSLPVFAAVTQPAFTCANYSIVASDTAISFSDAPTSVSIILSSGSSDVYINWNNTTATTSTGTGTMLLSGGSTYTYTGPPIAGFHYIGAGTTGKISINAHGNN
jgi:hypothetical protein